MANLNQQIGYSNIGDIPRNNLVQYPYTNQLLTNSPYDNYVGRNTFSQQNLSTQYLKCRPVSSKQEARAFQIDLDGSLWVFTDIGNNKIYTKQINNDGTASFRTYLLTEESEKTQTVEEYVTKEEFNKVIQSLMAAIRPVQELASAQNNSAKRSINF